MPCIFCIAVFIAIAGAITATGIDRIEEKLGEDAAEPVRRTADTGSVAKLETSFAVNGRAIPVAVTVYKNHARARIQVMTHDITKDDAEKLQNHIADQLDLRIVGRSSPDSEAKVHEAFHQHADRFGEGGPAGAAPPVDN